MSKERNHSMSDTADNSHGTVSVVSDNQLDRIEGRLNQLWSRVDALDRRASFWGAMSAVAIAIITKLTGCM